MKQPFKALLAALLLALLTGACVKDHFDNNYYVDILEDAFPVDSIDSTHTWTLTTKGTTLVKTAGLSGVEWIRILSGNPFDSDDVEILAEARMGTANSKTLTYDAPSRNSSICVAAQDAHGSYLSLATAAVGAGTVELTAAGVPSGTPSTVHHQRIFYCFEENFPDVGDWDYNDIVLSVSRLTTDEANTVALNVTLEAAGSVLQLAAAIRLVGYQQRDVTIRRDTSTTFVRYPDRERVIIKDSAEVISSFDGEPVINLFDDAHVAFYHLSVATGEPFRRYFNTVNNPSEGNLGAKQPAITVTYYLTFDTEYAARMFTLSDLDPFILVKYGNTGDNIWEIHTYPHKTSQVLYRYYASGGGSYNDGFSWALAIPYYKYKYPVEEQVIGQRKRSIVTGAYQEEGHAFGEWILDKNTATDWYLYPSNAVVFNSSTSIF